MKKKYKYVLAEIYAKPGDKVVSGQAIGRLELIEVNE